ncbi:unnamed protein product, partial [Protopolystoma xenopodis]
QYQSHTAETDQEDISTSLFIEPGDRLSDENLPPPKGLGPDENITAAIFVSEPTSCNQSPKSFIEEITPSGDGKIGVGIDHLQIGSGSSLLPQTRLSVSHKIHSTPHQSMDYQNTEVSSEFTITHSDLTSSTPRWINL